MSVLKVCLVILSGIDYTEHRRRGVTLLVTVVENEIQPENSGRNVSDCKGRNKNNGKFGDKLLSRLR